MIIVQTMDRLCGFYLHGDRVRGLFSSRVIPKYATTAPIPCDVAVGKQKRDVADEDDVDDNDGMNDHWDTHIIAAVSDDPEIDTSDGITFLGNGLIKLSPKFFGTMHSSHFDFVVFGVLKSSG